MHHIAGQHLLYKRFKCEYECVVCVCVLVKHARKKNYLLATCTDCCGLTATLVVCCEKCEKFYIVSNEEHGQPQKMPKVDELSADRQPFPKYKQPPVPTKVTLTL